MINDLEKSSYEDDKLTSIYTDSRQREAPKNIWAITAFIGAAIL